MGNFGYIWFFVYIWFRIIASTDSQIICSTSVKKNSYLCKLPSYLFLDYLATILPYGIEPDSLIDEPKSIPIQYLINYSLFSGKYVFIGESAHVLHPVGGQGLNLCLRDVASLTNIISKSIINNNSNSFIPIVYSLSRLIDILSISFVTDSLVRYSRSDTSLFFIPRKLIFLLLNKFSSLRYYILNILTNGFWYLISRWLILIIQLIHLLRSYVILL